MKLEIPNSHPKKMLNEEIQEVISECSKSATIVTIPNVDLGANYYVSMIELVQTEINTRIQSDILELITKQNKSKKLHTTPHKIYAYI